MRTIKILFVGDATEQQHIFKETVNVFNKKYNLIVEPDIAAGTSSALKKINGTYAGIIIDIKSGNDHECANKILHRLDALGISVPIIFLACSLDLVAEHPLIIKKRHRDAGTSESDLLLFQERYNAQLAREATPRTYTALIQQTEGWWIGWIYEVRGVTCQERTRDALLGALRVTLHEILEFDVRGVSHRTARESEKVKVSDILEFGDPDASHPKRSKFEEVKIAI